jgi:hypothetical protein
MPSYVLKADPNRDLYVEWSTIVDDATFIGTRDEMLHHLRRHDGAWDVSVSAAAARLSRADETGTSCMWKVAGHPRLGAWDDPRLLVAQDGYLRRSDLALYAMLVDDEQAARALLEPFEATTR